MSLKRFAFLLFSAFLVAAVFASGKETASGSCDGTNGDYMSVSFDGTDGAFGVTYANFDSFDQLNPPCDFQRLFTKYENGTHNFKFSDTDHVICSPFSDCSPLIKYVRQRYNLDAEFSLKFMPSRYVSLDVNLSNLVNVSDLINFNLEFHRIGNIEVKRKRPPIDLSASNQISVRIFVYASILQFQYDGQRLNRETCIQAIRELGAANSIEYFPLFSQPYRAFYEFSSDNALSYGICPIVFQGSRAYSLTFKSLKRSELVLNTLNFMNVTEGLSAEESQSLEIILRDRLDSETLYLQLYNVYNLVLDDNMINKFVFRNLTVLYFSGTISSIEHEFFKLFFYLAILTLELANMRQFIHCSTHEWMLSLDREAFPSRLTLYLTDVSNEYFYPDEDFCLFKHLPVGELSKLGIYFMINFMFSDKATFLKQIGKSCTVQYIYSGNKFDDSQNKTQDFIFFDIYNENLAKECNFSYRLEQCNSTVFKKHDDSFYLSIYDITHLLEWVDFIGPIIIFPIVCLLGFVTNLLVILVITRRRFKEDFQQRLFKYILLNSAFNCVECALNLLQLAGECIAPNSVFCSSIRLSRFNYVLRIYFVGYLGEIMKTCSILTSLFFSIERLLDSLESKKKIVVAFRRIRFQVIVTFIVIFAIVSSFTKILDFNLNIISSYNKGDGFEFPSKFLINSQTDNHILETLNFLHFLFNDVLFLLINCFVDFSLLISIKKGLLHKFKLKSKALNSKSKDAKNIMSQEYSRKSKTERKTYYLLVFNLATYFICRFPELVFEFFSYFYYTTTIVIKNRIYGFNLLTCENLPLCYLLANFVDFLYMISYSTNIIFYFKFNKPFKTNMLLFLHIKNETTRSKKKL